MHMPQHMQKTVFVLLLLQRRAFHFCNASSELCASVSQATSLTLAEEQISSGFINLHHKRLELFHY